MTINELIWPEDRIEHIARHGITPDEVEQVCFGNSRVQRAKSQGENPIYLISGRTDGGRYIICVIIGFPDGIGYPVTARPMTAAEKQRFRQWSRG